jgi:hypothetical protein
MTDDLINETTRDLPEIELTVFVYLHCPDSQAEARTRIRQIRHTIETALADEDNDLATFTYPEVAIGNFRVRSGVWTAERP